MIRIWTWEGKYFGYRRRDDLFTLTGKHVGRFRGEELFDLAGMYLGEVQDDRLIRNRLKRGRMGPRPDAPLKGAPAPALADIEARQPTGQFEGFPGPETFG